ncbi:unnamed protein product [Pleuronectes platessa]|uniref:Uncharacterized protein n=1 Tax=Pleuronectes platessa TaxID=8262 RepID=A0A9N7VML7_PLEPL|nr:unnamed protein product [Pleuronectes platessa]
MCDGITTNDFQMAVCENYFQMGVGGFRPYPRFPYMFDFSSGGGKTKQRELEARRRSGSLVTISNSRRSCEGDFCSQIGCDHVGLPSNQRATSGTFPPTVNAWLVVSRPRRSSWLFCFGRFSGSPASALHILKGKQSRDYVVSSRRARQDAGRLLLGRVLVNSCQRMTMRCSMERLCSCGHILEDWVVGGWMEDKLQKVTDHSSDVGEKCQPYGQSDYAEGSTNTWRRVFQITVDKQLDLFLRLKAVPPKTHFFRQLLLNSRFGRSSRVDALRACGARCGLGSGGAALCQNQVVHVLMLHGPCPMSIPERAIAQNHGDYVVAEDAETPRIRLFDAS